MRFRLIPVLLLLLLSSMGTAACGQASQEIPAQPVAHEDPAVADKQYSTYQTIRVLDPLLQAVKDYVDTDYVSIDDDPSSPKVQQVADTKLASVALAFENWVAFLDLQQFSQTAPAKANMAALEYNSALEDFLAVQAEFVNTWKKCLEGSPGELKYLICMAPIMDFERNEATLARVKACTPLLLAQLGIKSS